MRHPQHGNILLPGVAMDNVIDVALVSVIQRAGDFVQQQRLRQELQVTDQRDALLFPSRQFGDRFGQRLRRKPEPSQIVGKLFGSGVWLRMCGENQIVVHRVAKQGRRLHAV